MTEAQGGARMDGTGTPAGEAASVANARAGGDAGAMGLVIELLREMQEWRKEYQRERDEASRERALAARERRSERRWRMFFQAAFFGVPLLLSVVYMLFALGASGFSFGPLTETVGLVKISGEISSKGLASADKVVPAMEEAFAHPRVRAVVISIDSPGGSPAEAERIYKAMGALRARHQKPVVAVISGTGASAAYMIAMHADSIHAASYSLVGSIGAVMTGWDFHRAMDRLEVAQRVYASGNLKAMLNPFAPNTPEADAKARALVSGLGGAFVAEVHRMRGSRLKRGVDFGTGEVWGGYEAKELGLVDSVNTLEEVVAAKWPGLRVHSFGPRLGSGFGSLFAESGMDVGGLIERVSAPFYATLR